GNAVVGAVNFGPALVPGLKAELQRDLGRFLVLDFWRQPNVELFRRNGEVIARRIGVPRVRRGPRAVMLEAKLPAAERALTAVAPRRLEEIGGIGHDAVLLVALHEDAVIAPRRSVAQMKTRPMPLREYRVWLMEISAETAGAPLAIEPAFTDDRLALAIDRDG